MRSAFRLKSIPAKGHTESDEVDAVSVLSTGDRVIRINRTRIDDLTTLFPVGKTMNIREVHISSAHLKQTCGAHLCPGAQTPR